MLIFIARLQRFDTTLEEAGLDLGASPRQVFWRITVPYMRPAFLSAGGLAFLQSFENYTTTYFAIGAEQTFAIFIANKVRQGVTPAVNAVAFILVVTTVASRHRRRDPPPQCGEPRHGSRAPRPASGRGDGRRPASAGSRRALALPARPTPFLHLSAGIAAACYGIETSLPS